jgi:hypothetical protein
MASKANLTIDQGSDYIQDIVVSDMSDNLVDLTNYIGAAQIRKNYASNAYSSFSVVTNNEGTVQISMNSANTNAITPGQYVWDCELTNINTGIVSRIVEGIATITPSVTK